MDVSAFRHHEPALCETHRVLDRVGDKWSLYTITVLATGTKRFTELKREVDGISQRMLTATLRGLERDGIVTRTVYPVIPPRVEYTLTPLGHTLVDAVQSLMNWAESHLEEIALARKSYDSREG
ncbi:winged helix-turn-helix transcriptional regulator [Actinomadura rudentiformis]|uniref:Helix-turn-helix transcriptional regulator n=1 Tax=Actinomadura rudentiformis TaxID=359158 RepID=A0A6H9Y6R1_9ACTN|nr:helix-turn-helix domain-containing protein [Actinomadura rudentiformis]KAB2339343.1 helix-turn-helix transcriptional regulator [Actinomadura rudentiformis]